MQSWLPSLELPLFAGIGYAELPWSANLLIALFLWGYGSVVGSFMNVVVWRLPGGKSVIMPRSRCPKCGNAIRWFDNVPVLGWLWLLGRCRNCRMPISARYPVVETGVALLFIAMAFVGPTTSGRNLPETGILLAPPLRLPLMHHLWLIYVYHLLMFCTLICMALIRYDRQPVPRRLFYPALFVGLIAPLIWPELHPVAFAAPVHIGDRWIALLDGTVGFAVAASLALVRRFVWADRDPVTQPIPDVLSAALVGLFLGWQAAVLVIIVAGAGHCWTLRMSHARPRLRRFSWAGHLVIAAIVYIVFWRVLDQSAPWLASRATVAVFSSGFFVIALITWFSVAVAPNASSETAESTTETEGVYPMPSADDPRPDAILNSKSYRLAERDTEFLARPELRPVRLQLELLKPEMILAEQGVHSTIVVFGGTQIVEQHDAEERLELSRRLLAEAPDDVANQRAVLRAERVLAKAKYYDAAREFSRLVSATCQLDGDADFVVVTGGGPGIMEAANRGAYDAGAKSIGLNITLPDEQAPNPYITPELCFQFHYFALRKMHFLFRAKALVAFPGGFGTLDELFNALTLRQTNRMQEIPIILYGKEYWDRVIDFQFLADEGTIRDEHLDLISYAETPEEAWKVIEAFHHMTT
jgi:uncharacterized protein (TIGR00730 family)